MNEIKRSRKSNGAGYTYKVGNSWKTVIEVKGRQITATNKSKQESRRLAKEKAQRATKQNIGVSFAHNRITVGDYLIPWLENEHKNRIAHSTYRRYSGIAKNYIVPAIGSLPLSSVTKRELGQFLTSLSNNGINARTRNQALALISVTFDGAVESGILDTNPADSLSKAVEVSKPIKPLSQDEVTILLNSTVGTFMHARLHIAFSGLRQGEALGLRWRNIDLHKGVLHVEEQVQRVARGTTWVKLKSASSHRPIHLSPSSIEALRRHKVILATMKLRTGISWTDNDLVFPNSKGGILDSKVDYARWKRLLESCGIPTRRLHDARHTVGTLLFEHGEGIETIRRVMGHSSINLTSRTYVHSAEAPLKSAASTMDKFLGGRDSARGPVRHIH